MKLEDIVRPPKLADLGDWGTREFVGAVSDVRTALIEEGWFDRTSSTVTNLGWDLPDDTRERRGAEEFGQRWSAADQKRQQAEPEHPQEIDFER